MRLHVFGHIEADEGLLSSKKLFSERFGQFGLAYACGTGKEEDCQGHPTFGYAGSTIVAYLTGTGPVAPAVKDGTPASTSTLSWATSAYSAKIGSVAATVSFAGLTPGFIGLAQMNIVVPSTLAPGVYPLSVTIDGQTSNSGTIAVK